MNRHRIFSVGVKVLGRLLNIERPSNLPQGFLRILENQEIEDNSLVILPFCNLCGTRVVRGTFGPELGNAYECKGCAASVNLVSIGTSFAVSTDPMSGVWNAVEHIVQQRIANGSAGGLSQGSA